jgi:hypothetical protein
VAQTNDDDGEPGRFLQTRLNNAYDGAPIAFPLDDVYAVRGSDGRLHAYYAYPAGYYGQARGCRVVWVPDDVITTESGRYGPGLFVDPCGGARFDRDGAVVQGPAERGLDEFATVLDVPGIAVDTHTLYCGSDEPAVPGPPAPATPAPAPSGTPSAPGGPGPPTASATPSITPTSSATSTPRATATPGEREECERVSPSRDFR